MSWSDPVGQTGNREACLDLPGTADTFALRDERLSQLSRYLHDVSGKDGLITRETADRGWSLWLALVNAMGSGIDIEVPVAMAGQDGELFLVWDNGVHRFEADLLPDSPTDLIYLGPQPAADWEFKYKDGEPIPQDAIEKLKLFQRTA